MKEKAGKSLKDLSPCPPAIGPSPGWPQHPAAVEQQVQLEKSPSSWWVQTTSKLKSRLKSREVGQAGGVRSYFKPNHGSPSPSTTTVLPHCHHSPKKTAVGLKSLLRPSSSPAPISSQVSFSVHRCAPPRPPTAVIHNQEAARPSMTLPLPQPQPAASTHRSPPPLAQCQCRPMTIDNPWPTCILVPFFTLSRSTPIAAPRRRHQSPPQPSMASRSSLAGLTLCELNMLKGDFTFPHSTELPAEFQERVSLHLEKHGCSLSVPLCHTSFADNIPTCVIAKVLEKPDPNNLSPHMSSPSSRDLAFQESLGKLGQRPQYKSDIYCSDTALYCPEERRRERRQSVDMQVKGVGFLRSQNSTDSTVEEDGFHSSFSHEAFPEYVTSLPTSSSYSSFSVTSEEKENAQASTLTASQQAIYLSSRDEMFERKSSSGYEQGSPRFAKAKSIQHMELADDNENSPTFTRTMSPYTGEPYHFSAITTQQALASQKMRSESRNSHLSEEDLPGQWRQLSVEDIGAYSYRNSGRLSPCSFSEQYYRSPIKKGDSRSSPIYASYKGDSFSEGDDICQSRLVDSCFLRTDSGLNIDISTSCKQDKLPSYKTKELRDKKSERITVQVCSSKSIDGSPVLKREYVDVSPNSSAESLNHSSMEASEIHQSSIEQGSHSSLHSKQQQFQRTGNLDYPIPGTGGKERRKNWMRSHEVNMGSKQVPDHQDCLAWSEYSITPSNITDKHDNTRSNSRDSTKSLGWTSKETKVGQSRQGLPKEEEEAAAKEEVQCSHESLKLILVESQDKQRPLWSLIGNNCNRCHCGPGTSE
ncbi:hypothetical protein E2320_021682 [Naja naja]|nr:hypothetical protein E2320_021682 [Naja naja]